MISLPHPVRVFLLSLATDLRKGRDALSGLVTTAFSQDPTSGRLFRFVTRRRDRLKIRLEESRSAAGGRSVGTSVVRSEDTDRRETWRAQSIGSPPPEPGTRRMCAPRAPWGSLTPAREARSHQCPVPRAGAGGHRGAPTPW